MKPPTPTQMWETFLRVGESARFKGEGAGGAPDPMAERDAAVLTVDTVRARVLPLIRQLERDQMIDWYSFLIHDHAGGVPTTEDDTGAYIHLRLSKAKPDLLELPAPWCMTRRIAAAEAAGDPWSWWILGEQSALVLAVVEQHQLLDVFSILERLGLFIHYFSNMVQLPFPRPTWME